MAILSSLYLFYPHPPHPFYSLYLSHQTHLTHKKNLGYSWWITYYCKLLSHSDINYNVYSILIMTIS